MMRNMDAVVPDIRQGAPHGCQGTLHEWFLRGLAADPAAVALRIGSKSLTYQRLHERALALAGDLVATADAPPRRVGLLAARSEQAYAGLLAAGYAGAAVVPLNPGYPAERTRAMITAADLDAVIADGNGVVVLPELADELGSAPVVTEPVHRPLDRPRAAAPDDVAYILFTSGSTGHPKGVPVLHRNVDAYLRSIHDRYAFTRDDVVSQTFDLTFDLAMSDLFTAWGCGGTLVCVPPPAMAALKEFIGYYGITVWFSSPSVISLARRRGLEPGALPSLRLSMFCGEPLLRHDATDWQAAASRSRVENLYGPTELTISCTAYRWDPPAGHDPCVNDIVPIGAMYPGLRYILLDTGGRPDPREGELCVTGTQMFPGYLDPADDAGRFVEHDGLRWYKTGDVVRLLPTTDLAYLGRRDHQVKIRGVRLELAEVEWGMRRCRGVRDAVAVVAAGELAAFYTGDSQPSAVLIDELGTFFPRQQIPKLCHHLNDFPLNANGKIDRRALTALAAELLQGAGGAGGAGT